MSPARSTRADGAKTILAAVATCGNGSGQRCRTNSGLGGFLGVFFAGSLLLEKIFQLDGMGLLGFNSLLSRDYNVLMGLVFIQALLMLVGNIISLESYYS